MSEPFRVYQCRYIESVWAENDEKGHWHKHIFGIETCGGVTTGICWGGEWGNPTSTHSDCVWEACVCPCHTVEDTPFITKLWKALGLG